MQVNTEILKNGLGLLKLTVEASDYREAVNNELKNLKKKAQIKGFRAGMVPMGMVKKMYGKSVFGDQLNKILEEQLNDFLQNTEWEILANPLMTESDLTKMDVDSNSDITFSFHIAVKPDIEIPLLEDKETTFENYEIVVEDALLDDEIERIQKQYGTTEEVENDIEETDSLEVVFVELDEEGNQKEEGVEHSAWISVDMLKEEGPQESVLALKKGDHIDLNVFEDFDKEANQVSSILLGLKADEEGNFPKTSGKFRMTIETVKRLRKAPIDRELYMTVFGLKDDTVQESEDEETAIVNPSDDIPAEVTPEFFRGKIEESLAGQYNEQTNVKLWGDVREHLIETTEVEVAEDVIRNTWLQDNAKNTEIEDKQAALETYVSNLKWSIVLEKLAKQFEIEVEDNEIINGTVREMSAMFRAYMGGQAIPDDMLKQLVESRLKDAEYVRNMSRQITEKKVNLALKELLSLDTTQVGVEEYNEILKKENEAAQAAVTTEEEGNEEVEADEENEHIEDAIVVADTEEES